MSSAVELAITMEAAAHARAAAELNPFADAEALDLGNAFAVYAGTYSPVNGVYGLGLENPVEERELREIERFFERKECRPSYWITSFTDPGLLELLGSKYRQIKIESIYGAPVEGTRDLPVPQGTNKPEPDLWPLAFTRARDPKKSEPDLLAMLKLHQRQTRFYLNGEADASYTFYFQNVAWAPHLASPELAALQWSDAREFKSSVFASYSPLFPVLYERTLHELV